MINLMPTEGKEVVRAAIDRSEDLDVLEFLFPNSVLELDVMGNNLVAIIKEDTTIN